MTDLPLCSGKQMSKQALMVNGLEIATNDHYVSFCWVCGFVFCCPLSVKDKDCLFRYFQACLLENMHMEI